jgi:hypothetical protein
MAVLLSCCRIHVSPAHLFKISACAIAFTLCMGFEYPCISMLLKLTGSAVHLQEFAMAMSILAFLVLLNIQYFVKEETSLMLLSKKKLH